jgi:hypothetical protein
MGKCVVDVRGRHVLLDAFNVLVTIETALGGGFVFVGRDGAMRDLAGLRGSYRVVEETERALAIVADVLGEAASLEWLLDAPIANSGRLRARIEAFHFACPSTARVLANPDAELKEREFVASSDALVLDRCVSWAPVSRWAVERVPGARVVRL